MSVYVFNEFILALSATAWGVWVLYLVATMPWSPVRVFFCLVALVPGLALLAMQVPAVRAKLTLVDWGEFPASVRVRQILHFWLAWTWMMVAVAICLGDTTRPIHCVPYVAIAFIHAGKTLRLAHYDR